MSRRKVVFREIDKQINLELARLKCARRVRISDYPRLVARSEEIYVGDGKKRIVETWEDEKGRKTKITSAWVKI